jgi:hypothetical protein
MPLNLMPHINDKIRIEKQSVHENMAPLNGISKINCKSIPFLG